MHEESEFRSHARPGNHALISGYGQRRATLRDEDVWGRCREKHIRTRVAELQEEQLAIHTTAEDAQKGATVFDVCKVCHAIGPGAQNKIGPAPNGLDGRKGGTVPNFDYSNGMAHCTPRT
jgi:hypothetical protein